jgi:hypothetical protein
VGVFAAVTSLIVVNDPLAVLCPVERGDDGVGPVHLDAGLLHVLGCEAGEREELVGGILEDGVGLIRPVVDDQLGVSVEQVRQCGG